MSAAGLVLPGDKVDVILTQNFDDAAVDRAHRSVGETVLRDVRVIAVDNWLSGTPKLSLVEQRLGPSEGRGTKTVTLDVDEHDAEKLFVAMQIGKVELTVRALAVMQTPVAAPPMPAPTWAADVSPALNSLVRRPPPPPPAAVPSTPAPQAEAPRSRIEVMHGEKIEIR
jgi:pilus assembly protein CpaB